MLTRAILIFPDKQECVIFTVHKSISLLGITLCGSENNRYSVTISILKLDSGTVCLLRKFPSVFIAEGLHSFYGLRILFDDPIVIKKGIRYFLIKKPQLLVCKTCFDILMSSSVVNAILTVVHLNLYEITLQITYCLRTI